MIVCRKYSKRKINRIWDFLLRLGLGSHICEAISILRGEGENPVYNYDWQAEEWCNHPELIPTGWDQPKPEPARMNKCGCGMNAICPVCGWGRGAAPCRCVEDYADASTTIYRDGDTVYLNPERGSPITEGRKPNLMSPYAFGRCSRSDDSLDS